MTLPRSVRVQAVIERPSAPPWIGELPFAAPADSWRGQMLAWRWLDKEQEAWSALVRYSRDGLSHEHWMSGELLDAEPDDNANVSDTA